MTLVSIKQELIKAKQGRYAVPLYDVFEMQGMEGMMDALAEKRAPTIIGVYSGIFNQPFSRALAAYLRCRAEETDVPMSLMLDHGASVEQCLQALSYGFTDVMFDGSQLALEENIANTKKVVAAAHAQGAAVEAELGHVGSGDQYLSFGAQRIGFTDPAAVEYFVRETGVDLLAIAFGNAHGFYKGEPHLDLDLVAEVYRRVDVPLVMHGGTGLSNEQFRGAIAAGISKINFATSIINSAGQNMRAIAAKSGGMFEMNDGIRAAYKQWCADLYDVFGATGKA
jgi:fructose-bisphosphate aldolase class II